MRCLLFWFILIRNWIEPLFLNFFSSLLSLRVFFLCSFACCFSTQKHHILWADHKEQQRLQKKHKHTHKKSWSRDREKKRSDDIHRLYNIYVLLQIIWFVFFLSTICSFPPAHSSNLMMEWIKIEERIKNAHHKNNRTTMTMAELDDENEKTAHSNSHCLNNKFILSRKPLKFQFQLDISYLNWGGFWEMKMEIKCWWLNYRTAARFGLHSTHVRIAYKFWICILCIILFSQDALLAFEGITNWEFMRTMRMDVNYESCAIDLQAGNTYAIRCQVA